MHSHSQLSNLKLNFIQQFFSEVSTGLTVNEQQHISIMKSVSEIWIFLFKYKLVDAYKKLTLEGISPSASEMNQSEPNYGNAWYWLSLHNEWLGVFQDLLQRGIYPSTQALSERYTTYNTNAWYWLASSDNRIGVFKDLLNQGIYPSTQALSERYTTDNSNAWYWLASSDNRIGVFEVLLNQGIYPSAQALNECHSTYNTNTWFSLACSDNRIGVFKDLLNQGIYPSAQALNERHSTYNANTWFCLAYSPKRIGVFQDLLHQGIYPSAQALNERDNTENTNTWERLAMINAGAAIIKRLSQQDILPANPESLGAQAVRELLQNKNLMNRLNLNRELTTKYHIPYEGVLPPLLTREREEIKNYYGFLYLFYFIKDRNIESCYLPIEMWLKIGWYLLPASMKVKHVNELAHPDNQSAFIKYHCIKSIDTYLSRPLAFFQKHTQRARSLQEAIISGADIPSTFTQQYYMSRHPHFRLAGNPHRPHEFSFKEKNTEASFQQLMEEVFFR